MHVSNPMPVAVTARPLAGTQAKPRVIAIAALAFAIGAALVFITGFAQASALHDAAHDTRHGLAFPCH